MKSGRYNLRVVSLIATCGIIWLLLSGYFDALLLGFGLLSCLLSVWTAAAMGIIDREGHPIHLLPRTLTYWPWLLYQIVMANIDVTRRILDPKLPISPTMVRIDGRRFSDLGMVVYANSITLTPGTLATSLNDNEIEIHSLTREGAAKVKRGTMGRWVDALVRDSDPAREYD